MEKKSFIVGGVFGDSPKGPAKPFLRLDGELLKGFGISVGDRLELLAGKNMLVLVKSETAG
jgi:hypothetical protein